MLTVHIYSARRRLSMVETHSMSGAVNTTAATDTAAGGGDTAQTSQQPDATPNQAQNTAAQANISDTLRSTTAEAQDQHSEKVDGLNLRFLTGWRRYLPTIGLYCPHWYCCYCCFLQSGGRWGDICFRSAVYYHSHARAERLDVHTYA